MAQSIKRPTLGFGLGHDLTVCELVSLSPTRVRWQWDSLLVWDSLPPSLSAPPPLAL